MPLVVFLKGINVGGHRRVRPKVVAERLCPLDVVSIGAAGTFVVRSPITESDLAAAIRERMPFDVEIMICEGSDILRLISGEPFKGISVDPGVIQFVSVCTAFVKPALKPPFPLPSDTDPCLTVLGFRDRFVIGLHRREMKAIAQLGRLEKILRTPLATRSWSTILKIGNSVQPDGG